MQVQYKQTLTHKYHKPKPTFHSILAVHCRCKVFPVVAEFSGILQHKISPATPHLVHVAQVGEVNNGLHGVLRIAVVQQRHWDRRRVFLWLASLLEYIHWSWCWWG